MKKAVVTCLLIVSSLAVFGQGQGRLANLRDSLYQYSDRVPALLDTADLSLSNASLQELFRGLAEAHQLNISLDNVPNAPVYNNFTSVVIADLLAFLCEEYQLQLRLLNNILLISPYYQPTVVNSEYRVDGDLLSYQFRRDSLSAIAQKLTDLTPYNVILDAKAQQMLVSGYIKELPFRTAMQQLAEANNLELDVRENGIYMLSVPDPVMREGVQGTTSRRANVRGRQPGGRFEYALTGEYPDIRITLKAENSSSMDIISQITQELKIGYVLLDNPDGFITCYLQDVSFDDFLSVVLSSGNSPFTYSKSGEVYMIGSIQNPQMDRSQVYIFKNRSVEGVLESIPANLGQSVQISEFLELNAFILSGSLQNIQRVMDFLSQIDIPVANVLIEVIVVEVNQGHTVSTGISAGLADSAVSTQGTLFPGLDMTLSSSSINDFLEKIDKRGVINLGKVTPQFYVTLQALENNNNLDLKSTPKLSTINGNEAELKIGQKVYYRIENSNITGGVNPIVTVNPNYQSVEANLSIKIKPFVSDNEHVTLNISAEFSDFIDPTVEGAPPGNATRMFVSKIRILNEEMIVLGGLEEVSESQTGGGIPVLGRIPVLRWIFSSRTQINQDSKLLIFIKPTIEY
jgi:type IV pilus assembly protein PilQ